MRLFIFFMSASILAGAWAHAKAEHDEVRLKAGNMSLPAFVETVADQLSLVVNATDVDDNPSWSVQILKSETLGREQAMTKLLSVLYLRGFTFVHDEDLDSYWILRQRDAKDANIPLFTDDRALPDNDMIVTYVTALKHFPAGGVSRVVRNFMPPNTRVISMDESNALIFTDASRSMARFKALIANMDTPEAAAQLKDYLRSHAKEDQGPARNDGSQSTTNLVLFSLVALIVGFLIRGYVIRRIEGGL